MYSKNKVLHQNNLDSFQSYAKSTFSVSDYFENNIVGQNLREIAAPLESRANDNSTLNNHGEFMKSSTMQQSPSKEADRLKNGRRLHMESELNRQHAENGLNGTHSSSGLNVSKHVPDTSEWHDRHDPISSISSIHSNGTRSRTNGEASTLIYGAHNKVDSFDVPFKSLNNSDYEAGISSMALQCGKHSPIEYTFQKLSIDDVKNKDRSLSKRRQTIQRVVPSPQSSPEAVHKNATHLNEYEMSSEEEHFLRRQCPLDCSRDRKQSFNTSSYDSARIQATTRTIASPKISSHSNSRESSASPESERPKYLSLSPVQRRALDQEKRVKLIEMRTKQLQWMTTFEKEKQELLQEIHKIRQEKVEIQQVHTQMEKDYHKMEESVEAMKDQTENYRKQIEDLQMQITSLKEKLNQKHAEALHPLAEEYERLTQKVRKELATSQEELIQTKEQFEKKIIENNTTIATLKEELETKMKALKSLEEKLTSLTTENNNLQEHQSRNISTLNEELRGMQVEIIHLKEKEEEQRLEIDFLKEENRKQVKQIEDLQSMNQNLMDSEINMRHRFTMDLKDRDEIISNLKREKEFIQVKVEPDVHHSKHENQDENSQPNHSKLQEHIYKTISNLTTIESLIPGVTVMRNDEVDDYDFATLVTYLEKQSSRLCKIIREKVEDEMSNQADDCIIS